MPEKKRAIRRAWVDPTMRLIGHGATRFAQDGDRGRVVHRRKARSLVRAADHGRPMPRCTSTSGSRRRCLGISGTWDRDGRRESTK